MDRLILPFTGSVHIEVYDKDGNLLNVIDRHNEETIWAKLHTPSDIYMDFITKDLKQEFGVNDLGKVIKTLFNQLDRIRSGLLNVHFSRSGNVYSAAYNWTNEGSETKYLYGLVSYSGSNVYTVFDMSNNPVEMLPNTIVVGRYQITYTAPTPTIPSESTKSITINENRILGGIIEPTTPEIREYKYTRIFVKTSDYLGVDTNDTDINSHILMTVSSSDKYKRAWGQTAVGQLGYKFLSSGSPGGADGVRYISYYRAAQRTRVVSGNVFYHIRSYLYPIVDSSNYCDRMFGYSEALALDVNRDNQEIRPWKFNFIDPDKVNHFHESTWDWNDRGLYCQKYNMFVPRLIYKGVRDYLFQDVMYLYWAVDNPRLTLFAYSYGNMDCSVTINGTTYIPTSITDIGNRNRKIEFDLTGLIAGEGIVVFKFWNAYSMLNTYNGTYHIYFVCPKFQYAGDFYGYAVPFAGFLGKRTTEITGNYISAGLAKYDGEIKDLNFEIDDYTKLDLVDNTDLSDLSQLTEHQYWVWVKITEKDKLAGKVEPYTQGKLLTIWGKYNSNHTNTHVAPVYVGDNNFITFRPTNVTAVDELTDYLGLEGLLEDTFTLPENDYITIDKTNREVTFNDDLPCAILNTSHKSYIVRKQGDVNYNIRIPAALSNYNEGNATVTHGTTVYEFETTIQETDAINSLNIQFTSDTVFTSGEHVTVPIADGNGSIPTDALETWTKYETYNIPTTEATVVQDESNGTDDILYIGNEDNKILYANAERSVNAVVDTLSNNITLDQNQNYKMTVRVIIPRDSTKIAVAIPKRIKDGSDWRYTNIETVVVTDGVRVIPWRLVTYSDYGTLLDDNAVKVEEENYVIILSNETLRQITNNMPNVEMALDIFFKADKLDEILPYEVDFYAGYAPPRKMYPDLKIVGDPSNNSISYEWITDDVYTGNVSITNGAVTVTDKYTFQFDKTKKGGLHLTLPTDNLGDEYFVTFKFKADSLPNPPYTTSEYMELFCALDNDNHGYGLAIKNHELVLHRDSIGTVIWSELIEDIQQGREYLVEMRMSMNEVEVYIDGVFRGAFALDVYNDWFSATKITLGASYDDSNHWFDGNISHFAIFRHGSFWGFSHKPHTYDQWIDWDNHKNLDRTVYDTNEAIIKVIMPYAIPRTIKVIDENGNDVEFCQLDTANRVADLNNVVFIKINEKLEWDIENWTVNTVPHIYIPTVSNATDGLFGCMYFRSVGTSAQHQGDDKQFMTNTPLYYYYSRAGNNCCGGAYVKTQPYTYRYKTAIVNKSFDLDNFEPASFLKSHFDRASMYWYTHYNYHKKYRIIFNTTDASQDPNTFFPLYITPDNMLSKADATYNWNDYYLIQEKTTVDISPDINKGLTYDICDKCNFVEVVGADVGFNARGVYHQKSQPDNRQEYNQSQSTAAVDVFATGGIIQGDVLSPGSSVFVTSGPDDQCTHPRKQITIYNSINLVSLISYVRPIYAIWSSSSLNCSAIPSNDFRNPLSENVNHRAVFATKLIEPIKLTPDAKLYHADGLLVSREFAVYKLQDNDLLDKDFKLKGWTVKEFDGLEPYRIDYNGMNPLVSISKTIKFYFTFNEYTKFADSMAQNNILIKEPELVEAFKDQRIKITKMDYGFFKLPDMNAVKLERGSSTVTDLSDANCVVINKAYLKQGWYAYNWWHYDVQWGVHYSWPGNNGDVCRFYYMEPFFKLYTNVYTKFTFPSAITNIYIDESNTVPKYKLTDSYLLTLNQHIGKFDWSSARWYKTYSTPAYVDSIYNATMKDKPLDTNIYKAMSFYYYIKHKIPVDVPSNVKPTWTLETDAVHTDIRYFAINNIKYNILWDPNKIPANKIIDFGHFTITGSSTSQDIVVIPIVAVEKTDGSERKVFSVDANYIKPHEITDSVSSLGVADPNTYTVDSIVQQSVVNTYTFKWFNSLLTTYNTADYQFQYGWIIYDRDFGSENITVVKSITVQPDLTNIDLYQDIKFAWYQEALDEIVNTKDDYNPDSANYELKVKNPNDYNVTDYQVRLDLSEIPNLNAFSNGIVCAVSGIDIPTIYENDKGQLTANYSEWNGRYIWVKIPQLTANSVVSIIVQNKMNNYMPGDVFDEYYDGENFATSWEVLEPDLDYHGTGQDIDNYDPTATYGSIVDNADPFGDGSGVALYKFDGNADDASGNYNGTWHGNEQYDTGRFGQAAKFDGDSAVDVSSYDFSNVKSISLWFNCSACDDSTYYTILGSKQINQNDNNIKVAVHQNRLYTYHNGAEQLISDNVISPNTWYHLVINENSNGNYDYYLDGNLIASNLPDNNASLDLCYIGNNNNNEDFAFVDEAFIGLIDQVRIFNRALTQEEIKELYHEERRAQDISERVIHIPHLQTIGTTDKTIEVQSVLPVAIKSKFNFDNNKEYLIGYGDADDIVFDVYVTPDNPGLVETVTGQNDKNGKVVVDFKIPYGKTAAIQTDESLTDNVIYYKYESEYQLDDVIYYNYGHKDYYGLKDVSYGYSTVPFRKMYVYTKSGLVSYAVDKWKIYLTTSQWVTNHSTGINVIPTPSDEIHWIEYYEDWSSKVVIDNYIRTTQSSTYLKTKLNLTRKVTYYQLEIQKAYIVGQYVAETKSDNSYFSNMTQQDWNYGVSNITLFKGDLVIGNIYKTVNYYKRSRTDNFFTKGWLRCYSDLGYYKTVYGSNNYYDMYNNGYSDIYYLNLLSIDALYADSGSIYYLNGVYYDASSTYSYKQPFFSACYEYYNARNTVVFQNDLYKHSVTMSWKDISYTTGTFNVDSETYTDKFERETLINSTLTVEGQKYYIASTPNALRSDFDLNNFKRFVPYLTTKPEIQLTIRTTSTGLYYRYDYPFEHPTQWNKYWEDELKPHDPIDLSAGGKLVFYMNTGNHLTHIYYVKVRQKVDKPIVQLMKKDLYLLVENIGQNYMIADFTATATPTGDKATLQAKIDIVREHNKSWDIKDIETWPYATRIGKGKAALGYTFHYGFNHIF